MMWDYYNHNANFKKRHVTIRVSQSRVRRVLSTGADFTKITAVSHFIKNSNLKNKKICISDASRNISVI